MEIKEIFSNLPQLETKRLILRKMTLADAQGIFEYASDPELTKYTEWDYHKSIEDSVNFLKSVIQKYENQEISEWGVILKEYNKFIGTCAYLWWQPAHNRTEIGYTLSRKYWGRGLMTEAVKEVMKFGFEQMELNRIEGRCFVENTASQRVLEKVGMKFEGILRAQLLVKGVYRNVKLYSILRKEYEGKREADNN
jgi:ribosomal-protein-alanine N-acetyltransferase